MIAFAAALLAIVQSPAAEPQLPRELEAYYFCVADRADALTGDDRDSARPAEQIVDSALAACAGLRAPALAASIRLLAADPAVQNWVRQRDMTEADLDREGEAAFERALRRRLLLNIAELRAGRAGD